MTMLECALAYAKCGWAIFPLTPGMKIPLAGSNGFKDASTDPETINRWWSEHPTANIGLATGKPSAVWVIDVDMKKGKDGKASLKAFAASHPGVPPMTKRVRTPSGGVHLYVAYDDTDPVRSRADILVGVDIRGDGGYVVLPPSKTDAGEYTWAPGADSTPVAVATSWYAALPRHTNERRAVFGHGVATKRDRSRRVAWNLGLDVRRGNDLTVEATIPGQKYICRCPFHDDQTKSAFFLRKSESYGFLYCSACDASWATEAKPTPLTNQIAAIEARLQRIKEIRDGNQHQ